MGIIEVCCWKCLVNNQAVGAATGDALVRSRQVRRVIFSDKPGEVVRGSLRLG